MPVLERAPGKQLVSLGEQNCESAAQGGPLVTLWPLPAQVHRTVSPTEILTVSGRNVNPAPPSHRQSCGSRWHAAHGRPAVLIDNAQGRALCVRRICSPLARFSPHQKSKCKNGCEPKNHPCCIRCFHSVGPVLRASVRDFCVESQLTLCGSMARYCAGAAKKGKQNL